MAEKEIEVEAKIQSTWRIRTKSDKFLLGAQCKSYEVKKEIMENKKKLGEKEIYIENDLTWKERQIRDKAWKMAMNIRDVGKKAMVVGQRKVRTEKGTWKWSERRERWFLDKECKWQETNGNKEE